MWIMSLRASKHITVQNVFKGNRVSDWKKDSDGPRITFAGRSSSLWAMGGTCFVVTHSPGCSRRPSGICSQTVCQTWRTDLVWRAAPQGSWLRDASIPASLGFLPPWGSGPGPGTEGVQCFRAQVAPTAGPAALACDFPPATKLNHCAKHSPFHPNLWLGPTPPSCFAVPLGLVSVRYVWYRSRPWFSSGAIRGHEGCCWPWNRWQYPPWAHVASRSLQSLVLAHLLFWQNFCDSGGKGRISG